MLSMGLEQGAAQSLVEYADANPKHAIHHMLKLLGIYRKRGQHREFQETAEKLRKNFNIQAEDWAADEKAETPSLEGFSRVSQHVQSVWNQPEECADYLRHLIEDNRDGARAGFPQSVAEEILLLLDILKETSGPAQEVA
jgi:pilus assembly protein FimV